MWTIRWRVIFEWFVCSWRGHDKGQFYAIHVTDCNDYFCKRCLARRPAGRTVADDRDDGTRRRIWEQLDWDGNVLRWCIMGSNVRGDNHDYHEGPREVSHGG